MIKGLILITFLFIYTFCISQSKVEDGFIIDKQVIESGLFPFIDTSINQIEWYSSKAVSGFFNSLINIDSQKVTILHIGDSHLQFDKGAGTTRELFGSVFNLSGRGMIYPYATAQTHATYDYKTKAEGDWLYSKNTQSNPLNPLSISCITSSTSDSNATFSFTILEKTSAFKSSNIIRVFHKNCDSSFNIRCHFSASKTKNKFGAKKINTDTITDEILVTSFQIPILLNEINFSFKAVDSTQKYFELYGVSLESDNDKGLIYHSVGINGADISSFLKEDLFAQHISIVKPELIILDLGTNDLLSKDDDLKIIENKYQNAIDKIKNACPSSCILMPSVQDFYYKGRNVKKAKDFTKIQKLLAKKNDISFYNYYNVSGGQYSMRKWRSNDLSSSDKIHLNRKGYKLKGELLYHAIINSYIKFSEGSIDSNIVKMPFKVEEKKITTNNMSNNSQFKTYKIRPGDSLHVIAKRNNTSVYEIKKINNLKSNMIIIGNYIKIPN